MEIAYERMIHFIHEREQCRISKEAEAPPPWTTDPFIAEYRYCNINREDDKVTRWIEEHIRLVDHPSMWFNIVISRFLNNPRSLGALGFIEEWQPEYFRTTLDEMKARGETIFNSAYMIHAKTRGIPKHHYLVDYVFDPMWDERDTVAAVGPNCSDWDEWLRRFYSMGDFMRNQIITDLKHTHLLENAEDWSDFCLLGPGTRRGLLHLYTEDTYSNLRNLRARLQNDDRVSPYVKLAYNDLNNVANTCCEFSKYQKLVDGTGRPKSGYSA